MTLGLWDSTTPLGTRAAAEIDDQFREDQLDTVERMELGGHTNVEGTANAWEHICNMGASSDKFQIKDVANGTVKFEVDKTSGFKLREHHHIQIPGTLSSGLKHPVVWLPDAVTAIAAYATLMTPGSTNTVLTIGNSTDPSGIAPAPTSNFNITLSSTTGSDLTASNATISAGRALMVNINTAGTGAADLTLTIVVDRWIIGNE
jgi:hypothetical protein